MDGSNSSRKEKKNSGRKRENVLQWEKVNDRLIGRNWRWRLGWLLFFFSQKWFLIFFWKWLCLKSSTSLCFFFHHWLTGSKFRNLCLEWLHFLFFYLKNACRYFFFKCLCSTTIKHNFCDHYFFFFFFISNEISCGN